MIVITGANGRLGRAIVEQLLLHVSPTQVGVSVRDPQQASDLAALHVRVRYGDFNQPETLADSFAGAERLLLISTDQIDDNRVQQHRNAITAAQRAGVGHILYTSIFNPDPASPFVASAHHAATEQAILASGLDFTILRNTIYMESLDLFVGPALGSGVLATPADGPVAYAARADMAEATARLLAHGGYTGRTLDFTGSEPIDLQQVAALVSELSGRPMQRQVLDDTTYIDGLVRVGFPAPAAGLFVTIFAAMQQGQFAGVSSDLDQVLGRPARSVQAYLEEFLATPQPA